MSNSNSNSNMTIGNVGGDVTINTVKGDMNQAGGDIVGGDKITNTGNTTSTYNGFKQEEDKAQFIEELENLRGLIRDVRGEVEASDELDEDEKDDIILELMNQIKALKEAKEQAEDISVDEEATAEQTRSLSDYIESTGSLMERAQSFGEKMGELSVKIAPLIALSQPILMTAKRLFGF